MKLKTILINKILVFSLVFSVYLKAEEQDVGRSGDLGYFFGFSFGNMLKDGGNEDVDLERLIQGMRDSLASNPPQLSKARQDAVIDEVRVRRVSFQDEQRRALMQEGKDFLRANINLQGVKETNTGLQYVVQLEGTGKRPTPDNTVVVHFEGQLVDGTVFDSSIKRGAPTEFGLAQVIPGWTEGLQLMKEGGKTRFFIPAELGYGPGGTRDIPPNSVLIFDVELIEVK